MSKWELRFGVLGAVSIFGLFLGWLFCWYTVDKGQIGIVSNRGNLDPETLQPGWHLVLPWKRVIKMNTQIHKNEEPATVPTRGGLSVELHGVMLYRLRPEDAINIAKEIGEADYEANIIDPIFRNAIRDACADFTPEALYTAERVVVESKLKTMVEAQLHSRGFVVEQVMIQDPVMPKSVTERIQAKIGAEQDVQRMEYVLKQKELDAKAKVVEAEGIAKAQAIVKRDLDHNYLVYLWIEALKESAKHNNAVIYIPTGMDGMPLFKSVGDKK